MKRHNLQRAVGLHALALALALVAVPAGAATVRLDDSGSYALQPAVQMQWRPATAQTAPRAETEALVRVQIRIDTRAYNGRSGRIYMVLPPDAGPPIVAEWQTRGRLLPGRLVSGERTLVYQGVIAGDMLEDQLLVHLTAGGTWTSNSRRLNFHFELDTE
ncbi:MAG: hypothetical protein CVU30_13910 [Betaproteobacteria bacterium HGW-Betaproteobacteria-3]|jgi:hypothetical protein|nr:MAG: hypothetical protein CVU30_13910 [Betaproteobacteria bacterium HGW-Betaproteobacteria-3]